MKKNRILSVLLATFMVLNMTPTAFADGYTDGESGNTGNFNNTSPETAEEVSSSGNTTVEYVELTVGESITYTADGEITVSPDSVVASAALSDAVEKTIVTGFTDIGVEYTDTQFTDGGAYVIQHYQGNYSGGYYLLYDASYSGAGSYPSIDGVWVAHVNGDAVAFSNKEGRYLNFTNAGVSPSGQSNKQFCCVEVSEVPQYFTINYHTNVGTTISYSLNGTTYYLNRDITNDKHAGFSKGGTNSTASHVNVYTAEATTATTFSGSVTFSGLSAGTTTAVVGTTTYNITVTAAPEKSDSVTIYHYISTSPVWDVKYKSDYPASEDGKVAALDAGATKTTLNRTDENVASGNGILLTQSGYVPAEGWWQYASESTSTLYWKGIVHNTGIKQYNNTETNYATGYGYEFDYIRYYNNEWETKAEGGEWTAVPSGCELVAYYLQKTGVTTEVNTYVSDWAFKAGDTVDAKYNTDSKMKALSFCVVYPDRTMNPAAGNIYSDSTLLYWSTTPLHQLYFDFDESLLDTYEVDKITYTFGTREEESRTITYYNDTATDWWNSSDSVNWNMTTDAYGNTWYDETTCWQQSDGGDPIVDGDSLTAAGKITGDNYGENDGILILIYLKVKQSEDNLHLQYWDDSADTEIANYDIAILNEGAEKGTFINRLEGNSATPVAGETLMLDDGAYVVNKGGANRYIQKDLTRLGLTNIYASGLYGYVKTMVSVDGKTLILHYNLRSNNNKYVIDFGLPVSIPLSDMISTENLSEIGIESNGAFGTAEISGNNIIYTPVKVLQDVDSFTFRFKYKTDTQYTSMNVSVYPATTVFYEEGFATPVKGFSGGTTGTFTQTTAKLGADSNVYGYDDAYKSTGGKTGNSSATAEEINSTETFDFTGTGIEIYASATTESGWMFIKITRQGEDKIVTSALVNTVMKAGTNTAATGTDIQEGDAYNVPVYNEPDLSGNNTVGKYTVTIMKLMDNTSSIMFDGFRVYNTLASSGTSDYVTGLLSDNEDDPGYVEMRNLAFTSADAGAYQKVFSLAEIGDQVYKDIGDESGTVYGLVMYNSGSTDATAIDQADLISNGPKNELYLASGASITFKVKSLREVQIGLKGVFGTTAYSYNYTAADGSTKTKTGTASTVDMFYAVQGKADSTRKSAAEYSYTIKNTGSGVLSVTQIKFSDQIAFLPIDAAAVSDALTAQGIENGAVEENATLMLSIRSGNGKVLASRALTVSGEAGAEYVFTREAIHTAVKELAEQNGIWLSVRNSYKDVSVTYGSNASVNFTGTAKK